MDSFRKWRSEQKKLHEMNQPRPSVPANMRVLEDVQTGERVVQRRLGPNAWQDVPQKQKKT